MVIDVNGCDIVVTGVNVDDDDSAVVSSATETCLVITGGVGVSVVVITGVLAGCVVVIDRIDIGVGVVHGNDGVCRSIRVAIRTIDVLLVCACVIAYSCIYTWVVVCDYVWCLSL